MRSLNETCIKIGELRIVLQIVDFEGERYCELQNGGLLPEVWQVIYEWFAGDVAPRVWREAMQRSIPENLSEAK